MSWIFDGKSHACTNSTPQHSQGSGSHGHGSHRHRWAISGVTQRLAARHVHRQRFTPPAPVRDPGQERIHCYRCGETIGGRHGRTVRNDNGAKYTNSTFVDSCNGLGIRCELTVPYTVEQNGAVISGPSRATKAGHAARFEAKNFPDVHLKQLKSMRGPEGTSLGLEAVLWACKGFDLSATTVNSYILSPHKIFYGGRLSMLVLPLYEPAYLRVPWRRKTDPQAHPCSFLNFGYNHGSDCFKVMETETGTAVYSRDVI